jgi:hypothetical protein
MRKLTQKELETGFKKEFKKYTISFLKKQEKPSGSALGGFISGFIFGLKVAGYGKEDLDYVLNMEHNSGLTIKESQKWTKK